MSETLIICRECQAHIHHHEGRCDAVAHRVFRSAGGEREIPAQCECEAIGTADADTQAEVVLR